MMTIARASKAQIKHYSTLTQKKYRQQERKFLVEGARLVEEALAAKYPLASILVTGSFLEKPDHAGFIRQIEASNFPFMQISESDLAKISDTVTSQGIVAVAGEVHTDEKAFWKSLPASYTLVALDSISDPGNLGTILRTCDWFGVNGVFLSNDTVELYNPKVVRSTMGAIFHLPVFSDVELKKLIDTAKSQGVSVIATTLGGGADAFKHSFNKKSLLIFGSEAHGLSPDILSGTDVRLTIPRFGKGESLNVAAACAALLALKNNK